MNSDNKLHKPEKHELNTQKWTPEAPLAETQTPSTSRRRFFSALAAAVAGTAALLSSTRASVTKAIKSKKQYAMLIDTRRCIGCHACTVACKSEFDVPLGENRSWVEYVEKGVFPNVSRNFLPRLCNHCTNPPCVDVCPTNATYKREQDGIVVTDKGLCIGCKYCIQACPYDARFLNPVTGFAEKCDFCIHRVSNGLEPSCVNTCVGGARIFGDMADPESNISKQIAKNPVTVLRGEMGTLPNVYYIGADHSDEIDNRRGGRIPIKVITHRRHKKRR